MSELLIPSAEKNDIAAPLVQSGGTAIILQRHERYQRDLSAEDSGSLIPDPEQITLHNDRTFFEDVLRQEDADGAETMFLFISSDTQYSGKGYRGIETGEIALAAASEVLIDHGIEPSQRIINISPDFSTREHTASKSKLRPLKKLREPKIFDTPEYVDHLREKYGPENGAGTGISQEAWAAHESDKEEIVRKELGAEGVYDIIDRTKSSIKILQRYAKAFHATHPNKRLIIWATTHYDTISPLIKVATDISLEEYVPVDYGGGVVLSLKPSGEGVDLLANKHRVGLELARRSVDSMK